MKVHFETLTASSKQCLVGDVQRYKLDRVSGRITGETGVIARADSIRFILLIIRDGALSSQIFIRDIHSKMPKLLADYSLGFGKRFAGILYLKHALLGVAVPQPVSAIGVPEIPV